MTKVLFQHSHFGAVEKGAQIAVVGGISTGKTRLAFGLLASLILAGQKVGIVVNEDHNDWVVKTLQTEVARLQSPQSTIDPDYFTLETGYQGLEGKVVFYNGLFGFEEAIDRAKSEGTPLGVDALFIDELMVVTAPKPLNYAKRTRVALEIIKQVKKEFALTTVSAFQISSPASTEGALTEQDLQLFKDMDMFTKVFLTSRNGGVLQGVRISTYGEPQGEPFKISVGGVSNGEALV